MSANFKVGQVVKWRGQIGDCFATIRSIHKPENASGYVLWTELECGGSFPVLAKNVSPVLEKEGQK